MIAKLKHRARQQLRGRPGSRFRDRYERAAKHKTSGDTTRRIVRLALAAVLVVAGVVLLIIPGPGLPVLVLGAALVASESLPVARALDWSEVKLRAAWRWSLRRWHRLSTAGAATVIGVLASGAGIGVYACWRVLRE